MPRAQDNGNDMDIDIVRLFAAVWERRLALTSLTLIVCAIAFVVSGTITPRYRAEAQILIVTRDSVQAQPEPVDRSQSQFLDAQGVASQVEIIKSADLIMAVAKKLGLTDSKEFGAAGPSFFSNILITLGLSTDSYSSGPQTRLIEKFRDHMTVFQVRNSRVIGIRFWSTEQALAAKVANEIAQAYLSVQTSAKLLDNTDAAAWLEPEIADLRNRVQIAEAKVADFRARSGLLLVDETETLATQQLGDLSSELSRVRAERADAVARSTAIDNALGRGETVEDFTNVVQSDVIQRLRSRQTDIESDIADLSVSLLEGHPRIKALRAQLNGIAVQLESETRKILRSYQNEAQLALLREQELQGQLNALKTDSARAGGEEVELRALEREATAQRELLEAYLARFREAVSRTDRGSLPPDARIISSAFEPSKPYFPKPIPIIIIAGLVTLLMSIVIIMLRELYTGRALKAASENRFQQVAHEPPAPQPESGQATADGPKFQTDQASYSGSRHESDGVSQVNDVTAKPVHEAADIHEKMQNETANDVGSATTIVDPDAEYSVSAITGHLLATQVRVAIVVSPEGDKGSSTSVMLARMLANEGRQTLLIDLTGSACPTRMMVSKADHPGITDILSGRCEVAEALHADRLSNAHIMPQGTVDPSKAMSEAALLPEIIDSVSNVYDIVVVECGPVNTIGVKRLSQGRNVELIFSVVQPDEALISEYLTDFYAEGFDNLLLMSPGAGHQPTEPDRSAA